MGVVWEAQDTSLARRVALKFVTPEGAGDRERRARLLREARALAQLRHPNVVGIYDVGHTDGASGEELFVALELITGTTARAWLADGPRRSDEIIAVWRQVASGLAAVHAAGIVHRDIKPDNVFVAADGRVRLGDFGLATGELGADSVAGKLTEAGAVIGTPLYMAPEQLHGEPATAKSDQFALCVCLWEALCGARPYQGSTLGALAVAMLERPAIPARADVALFRVLARGVDPDPENRWPDVASLIAAIDVPPPLPARSSRRLELALGAVAIIAVAIALALHRRGSSGDAVTPRDATPGAVAGPPVVDAAVASPPSAVDAATPPTVPDARAVLVTHPRVLDAGHVTPARDSAPAAEPLSWHEAHERAKTRLGYGDGAGCLQILAAGGEVPYDERDDYEKLRGTCVMAAGDCVAGRAALTPLVSPDEVDQLELVHCTLDAPPAERQPKRAQYRLRQIVATQGSCKPLLAKIHALAITLEDSRETRKLLADCRARDGAE